MVKRLRECQPGTTVTIESRNPHAGDKRWIEGTVARVASTAQEGNEQVLVDERFGNRRSFGSGTIAREASKPR